MVPALARDHDHEYMVPDMVPGEGRRGEGERERPRFWTTPCWTTRQRSTLLKRMILPWFEPCRVVRQTHNFKGFPAQRLCGKFAKLFAWRMTPRVGDRIAFSAKTCTPNLADTVHDFARPKKPPNTVFTAVFQGECRKHERWRRRIWTTP